MKLKKIASLALAGIMAVSMLAGCNGSSNNGTNPPASSSETTTTGLVSAVKDAIKIENSDLTVDVKEGTFLNDQLDKLIEDYTLEAIKANTHGLINMGVQIAFGIGNINDVKNFNNISADSFDNCYNDVDKDNNETNWYAGVYEFGTVTASTAQTLAAREIAEKMAFFENEVADTDATDVKALSYTMYVAQKNVSKADDSSVPTVFVVLKVDASQKTI